MCVYVRFYIFVDVFASSISILLVSFYYQKYSNNKCFIRIEMESINLLVSAPIAIFCEYTLCITLPSVHKFYTMCYHHQIYHGNKLCLYDILLYCINVSLIKYSNSKLHLNSVANNLGLWSCKTTIIKVNNHKNRVCVGMCWPMQVTEHLWVRVVLDTTCPRPETTWVGVFLRTSCIEYELFWAYVALGSSCPKYELFWVRFVLGMSCPDPIHVFKHPKSHVQMLVRRF